MGASPFSLSAAREVDSELGEIKGEARESKKTKQKKNLSGIFLLGSSA